MFKFFTVIIAVVFVFIIAPSPILAQAQPGQCCDPNGASFPTCVSTATCSRYVGPPFGAGCAPTYLTCQGNTPNNPNITLPSTPSGFNFSGATGTNSVGTVIGGALPYFFAIAGFALLIYLLIGAITLLSGYGDPEKNAQGSKIITRALIGYIILFLSFLLVEVIELILGLNITGINP